MKILFLSIEFSISTFSGNGIYAISQVRALRQLGHQVLVICGRPAATAPTADVLSIPLSIWSRLDLESSWKEYALGCGAPSIVNAVVNFEADLVLGVDWHSYAAYQNLSEALQAEISSLSSFEIKKLPPYACSNYRVYLRSLSHSENNDGSDDDDANKRSKEVELIRKLEGESLLCGFCSTVLSASDKNFVEENYYNYYTDLDSLLPPPLHVLLPALRADLAAIPLPNEEVQKKKERKYLLCCVRGSPEKEPHRFVNLICELQRRGVFNKHGIVPLLVGSGWKVPSRDGTSVLEEESTFSLLEKYVLNLREQVESQVPCCQVIETFLGPVDMAEIYSQTVLNIHPPAYDAYGMTICEAASQLAPSLVAHLGHVGATDLLLPERNEIFVTDMEDTVENVADVVENLLENREILKKVGKNAAVVARNWNEEANAAELTRVLKDSLRNYKEKESSISRSKRVESQSQSCGDSPFFKKISRRGGIDVLIPLVSSPSTDAVGDEPHMAYSAYKFFEETYLAANRPVIFSGIAKKWRARTEFVTSAQNLNIDTANATGKSSSAIDSSSGAGAINIEKLEDLFGASRVVATDTARRHRGQGPCQEMSLAEYCQWWKEHQHQQKKTMSKHCDKNEEDDDDDEGEEQLWYLKDWHFTKDSNKYTTTSPSTSTNSKSANDFYYYQLPMYFSDDWLNEWYDSLGPSTVQCTTTRSAKGTNTEISVDGDRDVILEQSPTVPSCNSTTSDYRFLYLGPQGSCTPLHTDVLHSHSWSANIAGRKLWRILPAEYAHLVQDKSTGMSHPYDFYPEDENLNNKHQAGGNNKYGIDTLVLDSDSINSIKSTTKNDNNNNNNSTQNRFPRLKEAQQHIIEIIQYPGEAIFIPSGWYHTVSNLDDCLSINHNWISSHSVKNSWRYLQKERKRAEELIEDCREMNGAAEFEVLVQRNAEANAGLGYTAFGAMVRYIATKSVAENNDNFHGEVDIVNRNGLRMSVAEKVLEELVTEQEKILNLSAENAGQRTIIDSEEEKDAREVLLNEIKLNKECLQVITVALSQGK